MVLTQWASKDKLLLREVHLVRYICICEAKPENVPWGSGRHSLQLPAPLDQRPAVQKCVLLCHLFPGDP